MKTHMDELVRGFNLLSDPTRLGVLQLLAKRPHNVTSLCKALGMKQPGVSHHLGILRMGRLVEGKRKSKQVIYSSDKAALKALSAGLARLMRK